MPPRPRTAPRREKNTSSSRVSWTWTWNGTITCTALVVLTVYKAAVMLMEDPELTVLTGRPQVLDGDSIELGDEDVRLADIDAPEIDQICLDSKELTYFCGLEAKKALQKFIGWSHITCQGYDRDQWGRLLMSCRRLDWLNQPVDIATHMLLKGHAVVRTECPDCSPPIEYERAKDVAVKKKIGIWSGFFDEPYLWRHNTSDCVLCTVNQDSSSPIHVKV